MRTTTQQTLKTEKPQSTNPTTIPHPQLGELATETEYVHTRLLSEFTLTFYIMPLIN